MAAQPRTPNTHLRRLLDQARWTRTQFARAVNRVGAEAGLELRYDQSASTGIWRRACESWHRFMDDHQLVSTARGDGHFEAMRRRVRPYRDTRAVREALERAQGIAVTKA